jgi:hypothetical protein
MQASRWESSGGSGRQHDTWIMQMLFVSGGR